MHLARVFTRYLQPREDTSPGGFPKGLPQGLWSALGHFCFTLVFNFDNTEPLRRGGPLCVHTYIARGVVPSCIWYQGGVNMHI